MGGSPFKLIRRGERAVLVLPLSIPLFGCNAARWALSPNSLRSAKRRRLAGGVYASRGGQDAFSRSEKRPWRHALRQGLLTLPPARPKVSSFRAAAETCGRALWRGRETSPQRRDLEGRTTR